MKKMFLSLVGMFLVVAFLNGQESIDAKVQALLSKMTLDEKIGQMNQYSGFFDVTGPAPAFGDNKNKYEHIKKGLVGSMLNVRGAEQVRAFQKIAVENSRLGIPMIFGFDVIHGFKTQAPIPLAEAASWDLEAIEKSARIGAIESSAAGLNWTFAPMVDISRDARWGRVMEGAGEDPYLGSLIAKARVKGFQGDDLSQSNTIAACAKHFAAYGFVEAGKEYNTADIGLSTLYNVVFPPFRAALEADVKTVMNSFNQLNGIPATGDVFLQRDILKGKWNFKGFVISDWGSIGEMTTHGFAVDEKQAAEYAANAGSDMDMESHVYVKFLKELVVSGKVSESKIDDAAGRILRVKFELGLFDDPYKYCNENREKELTFHQDHMEAALDMAKKSIVLLKNEKNLLPLAKEGKNIALIGQLSDDKNSPLGGWRLASDDNSAVSVKEGMTKYNGNKLSHSKGVTLFKGTEHFVMPLDINKTDRTGIDEAVKMAESAEVVVMVLGEHGFQSGEGRSRADIGLPGLQQELLEAVYAVNKNVVLVLMNGRPLAIPWADENIPAIVEAWQLGSQTGNAIAEVLYGDYNPGGKLPMTFPRSVGQVPVFYNHKSTGRPVPGTGVFWTQYNDESNAPLYPFGYGLSYTTFKYSDLKIELNAEGREVKVSVNVKNTGDVFGEEVTQLYIRDKVASVARPIKELKGFEKFGLNPGEQKVVQFILTEKELGFYNNQGKFVVETGAFDIMVGGNSVDGLKGAFDF
jgi:beta-glucosidase